MGVNLGLFWYLDGRRIPRRLSRRRGGRGISWLFGLFCDQKDRRIVYIVPKQSPLGIQVPNMKPESVT